MDDRLYFGPHVFIANWRLDMWRCSCGRYLTSEWLVRKGLLR
jgi:hypothetical protein